MTTLYNLPAKVAGVIAVILLAVIFILSNAVEDQRDVIHSGLINEIPSFVSAAMAREIISDRSGWAVLEDSRDERINVPPFNILTIEVKPYSHIGHAGTLRLSFYNDRLMETRFEPLHPEEYFPDLRAHVGMGSDEIESVVEPFTVIWISEFFGAAGWADKRLLDEFIDWINEYT